MILPIIVDVQRAFAVPPELVEAIRAYTDLFPKRIFTRFINPEGSLFRKLLKQTSCPPGSPDTELLIPPRETDLVLEKLGYGLTAPQIEQIKALGASQILVCGLDTDACVLGVMFSLFDAGIDCRMKKDLCWSSSNLHAEAVKIIEQQFPPAK